MNPFPGLRPFLFDDSHLFFGRDAQITELASRLRKNRFLAVVGTSGSGKSSLVRAGLLPELLGGTMASAGSSWVSATMRPGGDALTNLARSLVDAGMYDPDEPEIVSQVRATLTRSGLGLVEAVRQSDIEEQANLLLVVDQFEEIFRYRDTADATDEQAAFFVNLLLEATAQSELPIYIIITMRSDFLGDCSRFPRLADTVNEGEFLIPRLNRDQRKAAITGPVQVAGGKITDRLLSRLLNDIGDDPDQLPILQHALMRTWTYWEAGDPSKPLDLEDYRATGGMAEALSRHAEEVFSQLPSDQHRTIAEKLFKALTEKGADGRGIRRPMKFKELCAVIAEEPAKIVQVIDEFRAPGRTFLMPTAEVAINAATTIDISHESLMRVWDKLRQWADDEAQSARIYQRLADTALLHQAGKAGLYREPELSIARAWMASSQPNAAWAARYEGNFEAAMAYLQQSVDSAEQETRAQEAARRKELELAKSLAAAERQRAEQQSAFAQRLRWLVRGLGVVVVLAIGAMLFALSARREAQQHEAIARQSAQVAKRAAYASDINSLQRSLDMNNLGQAKVLLNRQRPAPGEPDLRGWEWRYLWQFCQSDAQKVIKGTAPAEVSSVSVSADGTWAAVGMIESGRLTLHQLKTGETIQVPTPKGVRCTAVFSPTAPLLAFAVADPKSSAPSDRAVQIWDLQQRRVVRSLLLPGPCAGLAFPADGRTIVTGCNLSDNQGAISLWQISDGARLKHHPTVALKSAYGQLFAVSGDASTVAYGTGKRDTNRLATAVASLDLATGQVRWQQTINSDIVTCLQISPDGQRVAVGAGFVDARIHLLDGATGRELGPFEGQRGWTGAVQFLADGKRLLSCSADQVIRLWDLETRAVIRSFRGHKTEVRAIALSTDQQTLVSGCKDGSAYLWKINDDRTTAAAGELQLEPGAARFTRVWSFAPQGAAVVTLSTDGRLIRLEGRRLERQTELLKVDLATKGQNDLELPGAVRYNAIFDPNRPQFAFVDPRGRIQVWNWEQCKRVQEWEPLRDADEVSLSRFSADGQSLVLTSYRAQPRARHYREWEIGSGRETRAIALPAAEVSTGRWLELTADGGGFLLLDKGEMESLRYDFASGRYLPLPSLNLRQSNHPRTSPDGKRIFVSSIIGEVRIFDSHTLQQTAFLGGFMFSARGVAFSPDGQRLVTGSTAQESVTFWDSQNHERLLTLASDAYAMDSVGLSPDGNTLVGDAGGIFHFWRAPSLEEIAQAEAAAEKNDAIAGTN